MNNARRVTSFGLSLIFLAIPVAAFTQRQNIYDQWRLRGYTPSSKIVQLADNTTMNSYGRKLFYVNHPDLESVEKFRSDCSDSEQSIVLGCYRSTKGIYIYDVKDARLAGVLEVTSAHEMLHAAYDRLSSSEKRRINSLTDQAFKALTDSRIKSTVEQYRAKDPSVVPNELHSILGTEVKSLPPDLESYYKKYFYDRSKIVNYSDQYESEFTKRSDQIANYDKQLVSLKASVDALENSLDFELNQLQADRKNLENLLATNKKAEYNAEVPSFNAKVNNYNNEVRKVQNLITQYNQIVGARNELALEIKDLVGAIDTRITPQQTQ